MRSYPVGVGWLPISNDKGYGGTAYDLRHLAWCINGLGLLLDRCSTSHWWMPCEDLLHNLAIKLVSGQCCPWHFTLEYENPWTQSWFLESQGIGDGSGWVTPNRTVVVSQNNLDRKSVV